MDMNPEDVSAFRRLVESQLAIEGWRLYRHNTNFSTYALVRAENDASHDAVAIICGAPIDAMGAVSDLGKAPAPVRASMAAINTGWHEVSFAVPSLMWWLAIIHQTLDGVPRKTLDRAVPGVNITHEDYQREAEARKESNLMKQAKMMADLMFSKQATVKEIATAREKLPSDARPFFDDRIEHIRSLVSRVRDGYPNAKHELDTISRGYEWATPTAVSANYGRGSAGGPLSSPGLNIGKKD